jgi:hypothetical protein
MKDVGMLDSAPAHNSKHSREALEETGAVRAPYLAADSDIARSEFSLFIDLKGKLQSLAVTEHTQPNFCDHYNFQ